MIQKEIKKIIKKAVQKAQKKGELPLCQLPPIFLEPPTNRNFGDWTTNFTLLLGQKIKKNPSLIGSIIIENISQNELINKIECKNGFLNFTLSPFYWQNSLKRILKEKSSFGNLKIGRGKKIQIEFGSANPTGPLHIAFSRNLYLGDTLANILTKAGYRVWREYYVNNIGKQIKIFARSVEIRYLEILGQKIKFPPDGYQGEYPILLAKRIINKYGDKFLKEKPLSRLEKFKKLAVGFSIKDAQKTCQRAGIKFDRWFYESELYDKNNNIFNKVIKILERKKLIYHHNLALWFKTTKFKEPKDDVLIRNDGKPTYFGSDVAYHYEKIALRKFNQVIDIWGADNSGNVNRLLKAIEAMGFKNRLSILIYQYVKLLEQGKILDISKRKGSYITLDAILQKVGKDVCRFFLLMRSPNSHLVFDLNLALSQSEKNPVYYVQYAYARICSILKKAPKRINLNITSQKLSLLDHQAELNLIKKLNEFPLLIERIANNYQLIHQLIFYALDLATLFHHFYKHCRVISEDQKLTEARLLLVKASQIVFKETLKLIGVSAPSKM